MRFPVDSAEVLISLCRAENQISSSWLTVASAHEMLAKCWPEIDDPKRHPPSFKKNQWKWALDFPNLVFGSTTIKKYQHITCIYIMYMYIHTHTSHRKCEDSLLEWSGSRLWWPNMGYYFGPRKLIRSSILPSVFFGKKNASHSQIATRSTLW